MTFLDLDAAGVARALVAIAERPEDLAEVYFERREDIELPPEDEGPGLQVWREEGFAVRLVRGERTWLASRDGLGTQLFAAALRQVARVLPQAMPPPPEMSPRPWAETPEAPEILVFPADVDRSIRAHRVAFPLHLKIRKHRRWLQIVGKRLVPEAEEESFYSCSVSLPWGRYGTLFPELGSEAQEQVVRHLVDRFRARRAPPPEPYRGVVVLGPGAAAVFLHEAIAHTLEADTLALGGRPEAAIGLQLGPDHLDLLDDPSGAPASVQRRTDDEGQPVLRRWLLRRGVVEQPLADARWAGGSEALMPGAARRGSRHLPPAPRSTHLELLAGEVSAEELRAEADGGLYLAEASRGRLDPLSGVFSLQIPYGRRIRGGELEDWVGPMRLRGTVGDLLRGVTALGRVARLAGAGWCAKGGQMLPVWATTPPLRLEGVEVTR